MKVLTCVFAGALYLNHEALGLFERAFINDGMDASTSDGGGCGGSSVHVGVNVSSHLRKNCGHGHDGDGDTETTTHRPPPPSTTTAKPTTTTMTAKPTTTTTTEPTPPPQTEPTVKPTTTTTEPTPPPQTEPTLPGNLAPGLTLDYANRCRYRARGGGEKEEYIFQATVNRVRDQIVYQAYDNDTCEPLKRYMVFGKRGARDSWLISKSVTDPTGRNVLAHVENLRSDKTECDENPTKIFYGGFVEGLLKLETDNPACNQIIERREAIGWSEDNECTYRMSGFENYVFRATTQRQGDDTVYQAVHRETCEPLNRYLYRQDYEGTYLWGVSNITEADDRNPKNRLAVVYGKWTGCDQSLDFTVNFHERWEAGARIRFYSGLPCAGQDDFNIKLKLHNLNDCNYRLTGYENYTFRPTTKSMGDETVFQGWDLSLCRALPRFLYHKQGGGKGTWYVDNDLTVSEYDRLGRVEGDWQGCDTDKKTVVFWEDDNMKGELEYVRSAKCTQLAL